MPTSFKLALFVHILLFPNFLLRLKCCYWSRKNYHVKVSLQAGITCILLNHFCWTLCSYNYILLPLWRYTVVNSFTVLLKLDVAVSLVTGPPNAHSTNKQNPPIYNPPLYIAATFVPYCISLYILGILKKNLLNFHFLSLTV